MDDDRGVMPCRRTAGPAGGRRSQLYLLRLWSETPGAPWRLAVRPAGGEEAIGLADLDELLVFLLRQMERDGTDWIDGDA